MKCREVKRAVEIDVFLAELLATLSAEMPYLLPSV